MAATQTQTKVQAGFERLRIWQEAHRLMLEAHHVAVTLPADERYRLRDQLERSSASVADNIAEGYTSYYYNEKIRGLYTARKEAGETQNHFRSLVSKHYLSVEDADRCIGQYEQLIKGINAFVRYLCSKRDHSKHQSLPTS